MGRFVIFGGNKLCGDVKISGSKNAALPIIFSAISLRGISKIENVPEISDVFVAFDILRDFGAEIHYADGTAVINTSTLEYKIPRADLLSRIRASSYLIGACLARFGRFDLLPFGGCNFCDRPIDMHLYAAKCLGASIYSSSVSVPSLCGANIVFNKISVGATVNSIIMASSAVGKTRIYGYAKEPHVFALIDFLRTAGAKITVLDDFIEIIGTRLGAAHAVLIPDMIEAGTYLSLSLLSGSDIRVRGANPEHLSAFLFSLRKAGVKIKTEGECITLFGSVRAPISIVTAPYPGFPTDLQPPMAPLLASFFGGNITENVWQGRFGYLAELSKFGINYDFSDNTARIFSSDVHSACAQAPDLRGGAALLLTALSAKGESVIENAELVLRGYDKVVDKLRALGAQITME